MCSISDHVIVTLQRHTKAAHLGLQVSREEHCTCGQVAMGDAKVAEESHPSAHLEDDIHQGACSIRSVGTVHGAGCKVGVPRWNGALLQADQELLHSATGHEFNAQETRAGSTASTIEL